ncbi:hypothetical protein [Paenibacillus thiaminolyticus]|uniref:Uncharacterized protein n=1 Tax=Paenibacillus thiaminolyticus TaxID=49283 RepID=A0A3A3GCC9_PANTH|nr:hypothetical protein [Paenibacillus thiaminolyticus]RJG21334.1 hypothetical protein DQX05_21775 [Paenibacillus thiaminolyticus]
MKADVTTADDMRRREEMKELLITAFEGKSVLYEIYEKRNWLDRLFTVPVLSMEPEILYSVSQVAEICEVPDHQIRNKRKEFLEYLEPVIMGDTHKYNYIGVFKLKMIDGLTGQGADYTIPQLKSLIYDGIKSSHSKQASNNVNGDTMREMISHMQQELYAAMEKRFLQIEGNLKQLALPATEADIRIEEMIEEKLKLMAEQSANETQHKINQINDLQHALSEVSNTIMDPGSSIEFKEKTMGQRFPLLKDSYPEQLHIIQLYERNLEDYIRNLKQEHRTAEVNQIKLKSLELCEDVLLSPMNSEERKEKFEKLQQFADQYPELNFEIRHFLATAKNTTKKRKKFLGLF